MAWLLSAEPSCCMFTAKSWVHLTEVIILLTTKKWHLLLLRNVFILSHSYYLIRNYIVFSNKFVVKKSFWLFVTRGICRSLGTTEIFKKSSWPPKLSSWRNIILAASLTFFRFQDSVAMTCASLSAFSQNISQPEFPCDSRAWRESVWNYLDSNCLEKDILSFPLLLLTTCAS